MRKHQLIPPAGWLALSALAVTPTVSEAATKVYLRDSYASLAKVAESATGYGCANGAADRTYRATSTTAGSSNVAKDFNPTNAGPPCQMQTATTGGEFLAWITPPVSSGFTLSGNIDYKMGCKEANPNMNMGFRFVLYRWSRARGGIVSTIQTSADSVECPNNNLTATAIAAAAPTSTTMSAGDRIVIVVEIVAAGGAHGFNGARAATLGYDGTAAYDAFVNFADNFSFSSDSAPLLPLVQ